MSWDRFVYSRLAADATVAALVSTRIYAAGEVPQGAALPRITRQKISHMPVHSQDGVQTLKQYLVQVDAWATTRAGAKTLGDAIRTSLDGYKGTTNSVVVNACWIEDARDDNDELPGQEKGPFRDSTDFVIWIQE